MIKYYFDNIPLCLNNAWVEKWDGLFSSLERKDIERVDYPGQHGYRFDRTITRFKERVIILTIDFDKDCPLNGIYDDVRRFIDSISVNRPIRLMRVDEIHNRIDVWDVDLISENSAKFFIDPSAQIVLTFHETAPVKIVYATRKNQASVTVESPTFLQVSWGDGTYEMIKSGTILHTYTNNVVRHHVILSGVVTEATITTDLQEICRILS
jgi:hypothetical protein